MAEDFYAFAISFNPLHVYFQIYLGYLKKPPVSMNLILAAFYLCTIRQLKFRRNEFEFAER